MFTNIILGLEGADNCLTTIVLLFGTFVFISIKFHYLSFLYLLY